MRALDLDIDEFPLQQLAMDLRATDAQVKKALRSTFTKMARWIRTRSASGLSKELQLPQNIIRRRMKTNMHKSGGWMRVWYGLDPVSLKDLKPRQTKKGVTAGKHKRPGGFLSSKMGGHAFKRESKSRLPIKKQTVEINDPAVTYIEDEVLGTDEFNRQFWHFFEHELTWRTQTQK